MIIPEIVEYENIPWLKNRVYKLNSVDNLNLSDKAVKKDVENVVIYMPERGLRASSNQALLLAEKIASENKAKLICLFIDYEKGHFKGSYLKYKFYLETISEFRENIISKNIHFIYFEGQPADMAEKYIDNIQKESKIINLITDYSPLKESRKWKTKLAHILKTKNIEMLEVDSYNLLPTYSITQKQEFAARTIRPKIHKILEDYIVDLPKLEKYKYNLNLIEDKVKTFRVDEDREKKEKYEIKFIGGESQAHTHLKHFLNYKLLNYDADRNDALANGVSNMSPYLAFGCISQIEIIQAIRKCISENIKADKYTHDEKIKLKVSSEAYIEELIVRGAVAENYCAFNEHYDTSEGFANWAKVTLEKAESDNREYIYTKAEFENSKTHDPLWNAAQNEMKRSGKMHGYMRMYWAKKILEWTINASDAMKIAIYLNDKYEIDGQSPGGYTGCAWSIGGVHDRAWFKRPAFGSIRYMARSGCEKKFDVKKYIQKWEGNSDDHESLF